MLNESDKDFLNYSFPRKQNGVTFRQNLHEKRTDTKVSFNSKSVLPGSEFENYLEMRQEKDRLLHEKDRDRFSSKNGRHFIPDETKRFLDFDVEPEDVDFKDYTRKQPLSYEEVLKVRRQKLEKTRDGFQTNIEHLNRERERLLEKRKHITEERKTLDNKPLTPPFVDDALPQTLKSNWVNIGSRVPPDPSVYRILHPDPVYDILEDVKVNLNPQIKKHVKRKQDFIKDRDNLYKPYNGELGMDSYEPWQLSHYYICKHIVEDEIDHVLDLLFDKTRVTRDKLDNEVKRHAQGKAILLIMEELCLETTGELALFAAREFIYLKGLAVNMSNNGVINQSTAKVLNNILGREAEDSLYDKSVKMFYKMQTEREKEKAGIWRHDNKKEATKSRDSLPSTTVVSEGKPSAIPQEDRVEEDIVIEDETPLIDYTALIPCDLVLRMNVQLEKDIILKKNLKKIKEYQSLELKYWSKITLNYTGISLTVSQGGFLSFKVNPNQEFIAVGSTNGHVIIYDIKKRLKGGNFKIIRTSDEGNNLQSAGIVNISWSKDSDGLATVSSDGTVKIWSLHYGLLPPQYDAATKRKLPNVPTKTPLFLLASIPAGAFSFSDGPIAANPALTTHGNNWKPVGSFYFPSFNILGSQTDVCITMESHEFIKFNTDKFSQDDATQEPEIIKRQKLPVLNPQGAHKFTNMQLEAELFADHKYDIICCGVVHNTGDVITVDKAGFVCQWKYDSKLFTESRQGFRPKTVKRIRMNKENFEPDTTIPTMVRFDADAYDVFEEKEELAAERKAAEDEIRRNNLKIPFTKKDEFSKSTTVFKPELEYIRSSGGAFHEVTRFKNNNLLVKYVTKVYKSYKVEAEALLNCEIDRTGTRGVAVVLYPTDLGFEEHHIEICVFDLTTLRAIDPRIKIPLTLKQYREIQRFYVTPMAITSVYNFTLSDYLVINIAGLVSVYSLVTGQMVAKTVFLNTAGEQIENNHPVVGFKGCLIKNTLYRVSQENQLTAIGSQHELACFMVKLGEANSKILIFEDTNTAEDRKQICRVLDGFDWSIRSNRELRAANDEFYLLTNDHISAFCADIVLDMIDRAVQLSRNVIYTKETTDEHEAINRTRTYALLEPKVTKIRQEMTQTDSEKIIPRKERLNSIKNVQITAQNSKIPSQNTSKLNVNNNANATN